ncbi:MAG: putative ABC transporter permease subunit [Christensenellales bacterium]
MRKMFLLARILLKGGGFTSAKKKSASRWVIPLVLVFAFANCAFSVSLLTFSLYDTLSAVGMADLIIPLACGATSAMIFLFGIFYVISVMYHADDIEMLFALPLRPYELIGAKFITLVVYEYIVEAFLMLPMLVSYGIKSGADILYYVYGAVLFLVLPFIALSMAGIIVMIVMRFTSFGKNKQVYKFVGGIIAMVLALGLNVAIQSAVQNVTGQQITAIMSGQDSIVSVMGNIFPGTVYASKALVYSTSMTGLLNLLLYIVCSLGAVLVFIGAGQLLYAAGVAGINESAAKRKEIKDMERSTESMPVVQAYVKKEIRLLMRSPIAFLNCVIINFLWPVILLMMVFSGSGGSLAALAPFISGMEPGLLFAILVGAGAFVASSNAITSTAISREGRTFYFMKYIPVPMAKQLQAKVMTGLILSGIGMVLFAIGAIIVGAGILTVVSGLIVSILPLAAASYAGLVIDAVHPKLEWMNEQQAIKQNLNVILHMLLGIVFAAIAIVPVLLLHMTVIAAMFYNVVVFALILALSMNLTTKYAAQKIITMDV